MGTDTMIILGPVAIKAESLKTAILREPILAQPLIEGTARHTW
jgi:hypothetical protein